MGTFKSRYALLALGFVVGLILAASAHAEYQCTALDLGRDPQAGYFWLPSLPKYFSVNDVGSAEVNRNIDRIRFSDEVVYDYRLSGQIGCSTPESCSLDGTLQAVWTQEAENGPVKTEVGNPIVVHLENSSEQVFDLNSENAVRIRCHFNQ